MSAGPAGTNKIIRGPVEVWQDGEWMIVRTKSGGAETTVSLDADDAFAIANVLTPELRSRFDRMRAAQDALYHFKYPPDPKMLRAVADRITCGGTGCEHAWHEWDTNAGGCRLSEKEEGCPFEQAEELRAFAAALETQIAARTLTESTNVPEASHDH